MFLTLGLEAISKELVELDNSVFIIVQLTMLYGNLTA